MICPEILKRSREKRVFFSPAGARGIPRACHGALVLVREPDHDEPDEDDQGREVFPEEPERCPCERGLCPLHVGDNTAHEYFARGCLAAG